ncbi:MAG TPA: hypothetical protein VIU34_33885 [Steroidobacter sp.]
MSNVVDLLERMGQSSRLKSLTGEQLAQELAQAGVEPGVQAAIVQQRPRQLEELTGASRNVCCMVHAPQDDEPEEPAEPQKQPEDGGARRVAYAG